MEPTLMGEGPEGTPDHVIANMLHYRFKKPSRGDLIVFSTTGIEAIVTENGEEQFYIKRVVGLPGEQIHLSGGSIFVDGQALEKGGGIPPLDYFDLPARIRRVSPGAKMDGDNYLVGPDEYFVLGDHSQISADSRLWGNVPAANIVGKLTKIYWPPPRWGTPR